MKDILIKIAENKIKEAMENGDFDDLKGKNKPLQMEDLSYIPEDQRTAYLILKNNGYLENPVDTDNKQKTGTENPSNFFNLNNNLKTISITENKVSENEKKQKLFEKIIRYKTMMERKKKRF